MKNGVIDLGTNGVQRHSGKFPLAAAMDMPFLYSSATMASAVNWQAVEEFSEPQKEFG